MRGHFPLMRRRMIYMTLVLIVFATGSEVFALGSGQTDRLKGAPFYKSYSKKKVEGRERVAFLPVVFDRNMKTEFFYAGREKVLQPLIETMNSYLDSLAWYKRLPLDLQGEKGAPSVYVGSSEGEAAPAAAAMMRTEYEKYPPMIIHIEKPSSSWRKNLKSLAEECGTDYVLAISLAFAEYPKADKGVFGKKVVLGTDYEHKIRFFSAEDKPVEVLQVAGLLLDKEGNILKAGSEGFLHEDTPFWVQVVEVKKEIDDEQIARILTHHRREDLPGQPLAWKIALHNLVTHLNPPTKVAGNPTSR